MKKYLIEIIIGLGMSLLIFSSVLTYLHWQSGTEDFFVGPVDVSQHSLTSVPAHTAPFQDFKDYWLKRIHDIGGGAAYAAFKEVYSDISPSYQHEIAHLFGEALYSAYGISALSLCDESFSFGCYHAVIGDAILYEGLLVLDQLDASCLDKTGCRHGIGHGLVAYQGYDESGINSALAVCDEVDPAYTIDGCMGGVFMEYNMRTMHAVYEDVTVRERGDVFDDVCQVVAPHTVSSCYFWLAQWLLNSEYDVSNQERYRVVGNLCLTLSGEAAYSCFQGLGYNVTFYAPQPQDAVRFCQIAAQATISNQTQACLELAAASYADTFGKASAQAFCAATSPVWRSECMDIIVEYY